MLHLMLNKEGDRAGVTCDLLPFYKNINYIVNIMKLVTCCLFTKMFTKISSQLFRIFE